MAHHTIVTVNTRQEKGADNHEARSHRARTLYDYGQEGYALIATIAIDEGEEIVILDTLDRTQD